MSLTKEIFLGVGALAAAAIVTKIVVNHEVNEI